VEIPAIVSVAATASRSDVSEMSETISHSHSFSYHVPSLVLATLSGPRS
jgi:hypothetical protein